ncbi:hypothetical protein AB0G67_18200 [Streptomyces sp. NPDC021056]
MPGDTDVHVGLGRPDSGGTAIPESDPVISATGAASEPGVGVLRFRGDSK